MKSLKMNYGADGMYVDADMLSGLVDRFGALELENKQLRAELDVLNRVKRGVQER